MATSKDRNPTKRGNIIAFFRDGVIAKSQDIVYKGTISRGDHTTDCAVKRLQKCPGCEARQEQEIYVYG